MNVCVYIHVYARVCARASGIFLILPPLCFLKQGLSLSLNLAFTDSARLAHELCLHLPELGSKMYNIMPSFYMVWWIDANGPIGSYV